MSIFSNQKILVSILIGIVIICILGIISYLICIKVDPQKKTSYFSNLKRYLFIALGTISLTLGILGVVTPGLPTTPFILLTGYLYAKGSPRLYKKLQNNKFTGSYLNRMSQGPSLKFRIFSLVLMWCMVGISTFLVFKTGTMHIVMPILGVVGTVFQLIFLRKKKKIPMNDENDVKAQNLINNCQNDTTNSDLP